MSFRTQFDQFEDYRGIEKYSEGDEEQYTYAYIYLYNKSIKYRVFIINSINI